MKRPVLLALPFVLAVSSAAADCVYPQAPQSLPNGAQASKDQMLAAQTEIKDYSNSVQEVYLPCLEKEKNDTIATLDPADPEFAAKKDAIESMQAKKHNAALDELQAVADRWNTERKAFAEAQKK
jgi:opacity protein-like surface antigen